MNDCRCNDTEELRRGPILFALLLGSVISLLNETLVNIAMPTLMAEFHVPATTAQWISTGFMLIIGILVPITAFLLEWMSIKKLFLYALAIFAVGTCVAGMANSFTVLLIGRLLQGIGTGPMVPVMVNTALLITPQHRHGSAMGLCMLVTLTAPAIAPMLSGIIVQWLNWRWLFYLLLPFAALAAIVAAKYLHVPRELKRPRPDFPSALLSTMGFGFFIYGVSQLGTGNHKAMLVTLGIGVVSLVGFVWRSLTVAEPMLDLKPFRYRQFTLGMIAVFVLMMSAFVFFMLLPIYFQDALLVSPLVTGLAMLPGGILNGLCAPVSGKLYDRFGPRVLAPTGFAIMAACFAVMSVMVMKVSSPIPMLVMYAVSMLGMPAALTPMQTNSLSGLPGSLYSHGAAIMNTLQMIAAALGSSLFIGVMSARQMTAMAQGHPLQYSLKSGISLAFVFGCAFSVAAFAVALFIRKSSGGHAREPMEAGLSEEMAQIV